MCVSIYGWCYYYYYFWCSHYLISDHWGESPFRLVSVFSRYEYIGLDKFLISCFNKMSQVHLPTICPRSGYKQLFHQESWNILVENYLQTTQLLIATRPFLWTESGNVGVFLREKKCFKFKTVGLYLTCFTLHVYAFSVFSWWKPLP